MHRWPPAKSRVSEARSSTTSEWRGVQNRSLRGWKGWKAGRGKDGHKIWKDGMDQWVRVSRYEYPKGNPSQVQREDGPGLRGPFRAEPRRQGT